MRRFSKLLSVLLTLALCLSLLPVSALADIGVYNEKYHVDDAEPGEETIKTPHEFETPLENDDTPQEAIGNDVADKLEQQVIEDGKEATDDLEKVSDLLEAIDQADAADKFQEAVTGAVSDVQEKTAEADTEADSIEDADGEPVKVGEAESKPLDVTIEGGVPVVNVEVKDPENDAPPAEGDDESDEGETPEKTPVSLGDYVGTVETKEDGTIDAEKSTGKVKEIADAAEAAKSAAENAAQKLEEAKQIASDSKSPAEAEQARTDLKAAQKEVAEEYVKANEAAKSAAENYALAEDAVRNANEAYQAALDRLHKAGYKLGSEDEVFAEGVDSNKLTKLDDDGGKEALETAQQAVKDAKLALADAAELKAAAEKQRDYAKAYVSAATVLGFDLEATAEKLGKNPTTAEIFAAVDGVLEAMNTLDGVYNTKDADGNLLYGGLNLDNLGDIKDLNEVEDPDVRAVLLIYGCGNSYIDALDSYRYNFMRDENGNLVRDEDGKLVLSDWRQTYYKKAAEKEKLYGAEADANEDLIYKTLKMVVSDQIKGNGAYHAWKDELEAIESGIDQYWQADQFVKNFEAGTPGSFTYKDSKGEEVTYEFTVDGDSPSLKVGEKTYTPDSPEWDYITAQIHSEMASQLTAARNKIFNEYKYGTGNRKSLNDVIQDLNRGNAAGLDGKRLNPQLDRLAAYLDCLWHDLGTRADEQYYLADKEIFETSLEKNDVMDLLLKLGKLGSDKFDELPAAQEVVDGLVKELIPEGTPEDQKAAMMPKIEAGAKLLCLLGLTGSGSPDSALAPFANRIKEKQDDAAKAQEALDTAIERYDAAAQKVKDAQAKLDELLKKIEDGQEGFIKQAKAAKRQLDAANTALDTAKDVRDAALAAQQEAKADYVAAMQLAITVTTGGQGGGENPPVNPPETPETPDTPDTPDVPGADDTDDDDDDDGDAAPAAAGEVEGVEIGDQAVPLAAGPVTRAQFVDYLWRHEGSPVSEASTFADVAADYAFAPAIGWAQASGLVTADEDGNFQPDELVTVQAVREILANFARVFGKNAVEAADLTTLTGEDGEAVLNCDEVLAEFFGEEYVSPVDESELNPEVETAA